jgi:putative Mn2+ efflux pump MntP
MRSELRTIATQLSFREVLAPRIYLSFCFCAAHFEQFAMQMDNFFAACSLVQVIHILGDYLHIVPFFQLFQKAMTFVGLTIKQLSPALVVKVQY